MYVLVHVGINGLMDPIIHYLSIISTFRDPLSINYSLFIGAQHWPIFSCSRGLKNVTIPCVHTSLGLTWRLTGIHHVLLFMHGVKQSLDANTHKTDQYHFDVQGKELTK